MKTYTVTAKTLAVTPTNGIESWVDTHYYVSIALNSALDNGGTKVTEATIKRNFTAQEWAVKLTNDFERWTEDMEMPVKAECIKHFMNAKLHGLNSYIHRDGLSFESEEDLADYIRSLDDDQCEGLSDEYVVEEAHGLNEWFMVY